MVQAQPKMPVYHDGFENEICCTGTKEIFNKSVSENPRFCVADFATLSDGRRSRSKIFLLFIWIKEPCVRKFEGLVRSKLLGISETEMPNQMRPPFLDAVKLYYHLSIYFDTLFCIRLLCF